MTRSFLVLSLIFTFAPTAIRAFDPGEWNVRCWDSSKRLWVDSGRDKFTYIKSDDGSTEVKNTSGIHKHAHFVFSKMLNGDFTFKIDLKGGYELGFLNKAGKDEMLYLEIEGTEAFHTYELSRIGTRFTIQRDGRIRPLVHFRFDYGEEILITLAIKDGESAWIRSSHFEAN